MFKVKSYLKNTHILAVFDYVYLLTFFLTRKFQWETGQVF